MVLRFHTSLTWSLLGDFFAKFTLHKSPNHHINVPKIQAFRHFHDRIFFVPNLELSNLVFSLSVGVIKFLTSNFYDHVIFSSQKKG